MRKIFLIFALFGGLSAAGFYLQPAGAQTANRPIPLPQCRDPWVTQAIQQVIGRRPAVGTSVSESGECDIQRYGNGRWSNYDDLVNKVREGLFTARPEARVQAERCFGAVGSKCDGIAGFAKTTNSNGSVNLFVSVGSIMHDNCCLANPAGKMCRGNNDDASGMCIKEWDKAVWNSADGRAWSQTFDPNQGGDFRIVNNPRKTTFRLGGTNMDARGTPFETVATRQLMAPRGTNLDVGDEAFCQSGRAQLYYFGAKQWISCL